MFFKVFLGWKAKGFGCERRGKGAEINGLVKEFGSVLAVVRGE